MIQSRRDASQEGTVPGPAPPQRQSWEAALFSRAQSVLAPYQDDTGGTGHGSQHPRPRNHYPVPSMMRGALYPWASKVFL